MPGRSGRRRPELTEEQKLQIATQRANALRAQIQHWLDAIAQFVDVAKAPKHPFTTASCLRNNAKHLWHVRLVPRPPHRPRRLTCTVSRREIPLEVLTEKIITPLRRAGYAVSAPATDRCGCQAFDVVPRERAQK